MDSDGGDDQAISIVAAFYTWDSSMSDGDAILHCPEWQSKGKGERARTGHRKERYLLATADFAAERSDAV